VGGLVSLPAYVTVEGEPYRPEVLTWMSSDGFVLGFSTAKPGELLPNAAAHLHETIRKPMVGQPQAPTRLRVASRPLASALRASLPASITIVCAPTPEIDDVAASMRERMDAEKDLDQSWLSPEIGADAVASFFRAAAGLFRAKPWLVVPSDDCLFSVTIEALELDDVAMSVIGHMGQSLGVLLFSGLDDFEAFVDAAHAIERGEEPEMPPHFAFNFEEIAEHRWEVAGADAYPWLVAVDEDLVPRPPTAQELTIAEALALALPHVLEERQALLAAWDGGAPLARTLAVKTHAGEIEVTLRAPYEEPASEFRPPYDVIADLFELARDGEEIDQAARRELEDELVRRFLHSPEAKPLTEVQACRFVMDFAADCFGATIATLGPSELREIVFEIIPRKVSIDASQAGWIIEENRAFFAFLKREFGLEKADACLRVLGGDAVERLTAALADKRNFGMAKSFFMSGREAGFDMATQAGLEAFMRVSEGTPRPIGLPFPAAPAPRRKDPAAAHAKKTQRKATRSARKKNR
jgi:hypothetical protein